MGFFSLACTNHLAEHVQQLSDRSHRNGKWAEVVWIEFEIGSGDGYVTFHVRMYPYHATTTKI
jgi:hypothetical protein